MTSYSPEANYLTSGEQKFTILTCINKLLLFRFFKFMFVNGLLQLFSLMSTAEWPDKESKKQFKCI